MLQVLSEFILWTLSKILMWTVSAYSLTSAYINLSAVFVLEGPGAPLRTRTRLLSCSTKMYTTCVTCGTKLDNSAKMP